MTCTAESCGHCGRCDDQADDRCPACHDTECCGAGPYIRDEESRRLSKQLAVALDALQFYAAGNWRLGEVYWNGEYSHASYDAEGPIGDSGRQARTAIASVHEMKQKAAR